MEEWYNAKGIGQLYIEQVLVHGDEPVLFVCVDDKEQRYLCMAYEPEMLQYVMIKISTEQLLDMLENKIPMDQTFRAGDSIITTKENEYLSSDIDLILTANDSATFPADHLPKAGAYYNLKLPWLDAYVAKLKAELRSNAIDILYSVPFGKMLSDAFYILYKVATAQQVFENADEKGSDISASYQNDQSHKSANIKSDEDYSINVPTNFDNRAA